VKVHCTFRQQQRRILFATRQACTLQVLRSKVVHVLCSLPFSSDLTLHYTAVRLEFAFRCRRPPSR
jgi:hypothetical protein